jgi:hypothetical protein
MLFREFDAETETEKAPPKETHLQPEVPEEPAQNPLENELEPDRSQLVDINLNPPSGALIDSADGKSKIDVAYMLDPKASVKSSDIGLFYKNATQSDGLRVKNPELYNKIDAAISQAGAQGRVIQNT